MEVDMPHSLTSRACFCYFNSTTLTDDTFISYTLVFSTSTFIVLSRSKYLFTKESSTFWSLGSIVYRFTDKYLPMRKSTYLIWRTESKLDSYKIIKILSSGDIFLTNSFSYLRKVGNFIIEEIIKLFIKHSYK